MSFSCLSRLCNSSLVSLSRILSELSTTHITPSVCSKQFRQQDRMVFWPPMSQTFILKPQYSSDFILKPRVGEILSMSSPLNFLIIVVFPALSRPSTSRRISFSFCLAFFTIDMNPISCYLFSIQMNQFLYHSNPTPNIFLYNFPNPLDPDWFSMFSAHLIILNLNMHSLTPNNHLLQSPNPQCMPVDPSHPPRKDRSQSIENILSSSIQRAKEKIFLMENKKPPKPESKLNSHSQFENTSQTYRSVEKKDVSLTKSNDGTSTALAGALKTLQSKINELEKANEALQKERFIIKRELQNVAEEKKIILGNFENSKKRFFEEESAFKNQKVQIRDLSQANEELTTEARNLTNNNKELEHSLKVEREKAANYKKSFQKAIQQNDKKDLKKEKMSQSEMLCHTKLKQLEEREKQIEAKEENVANQLKKDNEALFLANRLNNDLEKENSGLSSVIELLETTKSQLEEEKKMLKRENQSQIGELTENYVKKMDNLERELAESKILQTKSNFFAENRSASSLSKLHKQEKMEDLKDQLRNLREAYQELYMRSKRSQDKLRKEESESKNIRSKFWELKDVVSEIISKINKFPEGTKSQLKYLIVKANKIESYNRTKIRPYATPTKKRSDSVNSASKSKSKSKSKQIDRFNLSNKSFKSNSSRSNSKTKKTLLSEVSVSKKSNKQIVYSTKKCQENRCHNEVTHLERQVGELKKEYRQLVKRTDQGDNEELRERLNELALQLQSKSEQMTSLKRALRGGK